MPTSFCSCGVGPQHTASIPAALQLRCCCRALAQPLPAASTNAPSHKWSTLSAVSCSCSTLCCPLPSCTSQLEEPSEQVWQSAMGCLLHLTTHGGHWVASSLHLLPPSAAAALLDASVKFNWSHELHARLVQMAVNLLYITDPAPSAADCADAEAVAVTAGSSSGSKAQQASKVKSPGRWQQPPRQEQAVERQQHQQLRNSDHSMPGNAAAGDQSPNTSSSSHSPLGKGCQQEPDLDLPCQLHAGPVDTDQLAAFGGAAQLLKQFCYAGSVEAQRTLLVPLLQVRACCRKV